MDKEKDIEEVDGTTVDQKEKETQEVKMDHEKVEKSEDGHSEEENSEGVDAQNENFSVDPDVFPEETDQSENSVTVTKNEEKYEEKEVSGTVDESTENASGEGSKFESGQSEIGSNTKDELKSEEDHGTVGSGDSHLDGPDKGNIDDKSEGPEVQPEKIDSPKEETKDGDIPEKASGEESKAPEQPEIDSNRSNPFASATKGELKSEEDLSEKDHDDDENDDDHEDEIDYSEYSKAELVDLIKGLARQDDIQKADRITRKIKPIFDDIRENEKQAALKKFIAEGGEEKDFDYKYSELDNRFDANFKLIRDKKHERNKNKEKQKDANLARKQEILEKLREFVDSEETNISFDAFKNLQIEWKEIGAVPGAYAKTLWANYNALVDRFYDNRSIYFELKELDRRKNLESKLELCERAEKLLELESLKEAVKELNELHHEFKHIGPVPKEEQEPLWQRFKGASDAVYAKRREYVETLKSELDDNLKIKSQLAEDVQAFASFDSDRIKEWNIKTKELLGIQKKWDATGGLPRAKAKDVNKKFWGTFKTFFNNKNAFFKRLDAHREGNLEKKKELVEKAVEFRESTDWQKTAERFKQLQRDWKEIGPVPEKYRESIYKEFKEAADHFFNQKRANNSEIEKEYEINLKEKEQICEKIEELATSNSQDLDKFRDLQDQYMDLGFVPRRSISKIKNRYSEVVDKFINNMEGLSNEDRKQIRLENQVNKILSGPNADQKIYRKEQALRKQISQVENDIAVWKNNLEFFADSKTADKLKDEFNTKIKSATTELKSLKKQLRLIRTVT